METGKILLQEDSDTLFAGNYIALREKEGRLYSDSEVSLLPDISRGHVHYKEWMIRKRSVEKLIAYLETKHRPLNILEIGCGNGWLSNKLSELPESSVTGLDINLTELKQADRVFGNKPKLRFISADLRSEALRGSKFDVIVFAASIQYFSSLADILRNASLHLTQQGEIHIIDTPFYTAGELMEAKERTSAYYFSMGMPMMSNYYHHHCLEDLKVLNARFISPVWTRIFKANNPFRWVCISNLIPEQ
jgi:ubiquinone/menaquinone biosynthesis C-methylase UbiE